VNNHDRNSPSVACSAEVPQCKGTIPVPPAGATGRVQAVTDAVHQDGEQVSKRRPRPQRAFARHIFLRMGKVCRHNNLT
jgi:hypothetical protein